MMKKGEALQYLVASLEKALSQSDGVYIETPKYLPDITTGKLREHDVLLTMKHGHHTVKIAIECRDRSRPITVNQVEGFLTKCKDTGINQGIIVSSKGFYGTAKKKAKHHGIRCLSIEEVDSFNWLLAPSLRKLTKNILRTYWVFVPEIDGIVDKTHFEVIDAKGNKVNEQMLNNNAQQQLENIFPDPPAPINEAELKVKFKVEGLMLHDLNSGKKVNVKFVLSTIIYSISEELIPFRRIQYVDKIVNDTITDAAIAELGFGELAGKLIIVHKKSGEGCIVFVPEKKDRNT